MYVRTVEICTCVLWEYVSDDVLCFVRSFCVLYLFYIYSTFILYFARCVLFFVRGLYVYTHTHIVCVCRLMCRCVCIKVEGAARMYAPTHKSADTHTHLHISLQTHTMCVCVYTYKPLTKNNTHLAKYRINVE